MCCQQVAHQILVALLFHMQSLQLCCLVMRSGVGPGAGESQKKVVSGPSVTLLQVNTVCFEVRLKPLPFSFFLNCVLVLLDPRSRPLKDDDEYFAE